MAFSKSDFERLDGRLEKITAQSVDKIVVDSDLPPTINRLEDNNKTYSIKAAILFVDIRKSTYLTENSQAKSMVKIYRSFMRMAVECVRKNGGVTRQFLGDRIMGVFIDSVDENHIVLDKAVDKAVCAARSLLTVIDYSLNKHLKNNVNGKMIDCGIGIDYGNVLVTQVGMYGVESDENKENEVDCVWVGNTTNYASKFSDIASGGEIFISDRVFDNLSAEYGDVWVKSAKCKGTKVFQGYVTEDYYLDFSNDLNKPDKREEDNSTAFDTFSQLARSIKEIENLQNKLIQREKEVTVLEEQLKIENQEYKIKYNKENAAKINAQNEKKAAQEKLTESLMDYYEFACKIINSAHCNLGYTQYATKELWDKIIAKCFELGKKIGYSEKQIKLKLDCGLIAIYSYYKLYKKAYDIIVVMAELNPVWINMEEKTMQWAKDNCVLYLLQNAIETRLANNVVSENCRKDFEIALYRVKKMRGV